MGRSVAPSREEIAAKLAELFGPEQMGWMTTPQAYDVAVLDKGGDWSSYLRWVVQYAIEAAERDGFDGRRVVQGALVVHAGELGTDDPKFDKYYAASEAIRLQLKAERESKS